MFTGIVEEIGTLKRITWGAHSAALTIQAKQVLAGTKVGDSESGHFRVYGRRNA